VVTYRFIKKPTEPTDHGKVSDPTSPDYSRR
jgi:hypothetical protein